MNIYEQYLKAKAELDTAKKNLEELQIALYNKFSEKLNFDTGTFMTEDSGFKVSIVKKETVTVDQALASVVGVGFDAKYSLSKKKYKLLSDQDKHRVDECLTTKPAKPSFKVEKL